MKEDWHGYSSDGKRSWIEFIRSLFSWENVSNMVLAGTFIIVIITGIREVFP